MRNSSAISPLAWSATTIDLLIEKPGRQPGQRVGRSPWLQPVIVDEKAGEIGDIIQCANHQGRSGQPFCGVGLTEPGRQDKERRLSATTELKNVPSGASDMAHIVLTFDNNRLASALYGQFDENLARLEQKLGVDIRSRGNQLTIKGSAAAAEQARRALDHLYGILQKGADIGQSDVDGAVRMAIAADDQLTLPTLERKGKMAAAQIATRKRTIYARSLNQDAYMRALERSELVFGIGPAGTGKTYLAVAHAAMLLERGMVERIILSRPAVEAGERLGFLPGDMKEKVDPYLRPLYDALYDMMPADKVERAIAAEVIEIAPLAFMRGRTLAHAAVILDEAQNTTPMQMKMFLTRLGENSRMIVTGDPTQIDLPPNTKSGLVEALRILDGVPGIVTVRFNDDRRGAPSAGGRDRPGPMIATAKRRAGPGDGKLTGQMNDSTSRSRASADDTQLEIDILIEAGDWPARDALEMVARRAFRCRLRCGGNRAGTDRSQPGFYRRRSYPFAQRRLAQQGQADQRAVLPGISGKASATRCRRCSATSCWPPRP